MRNFSHHWQLELVKGTKEYFQVLQICIGNIWEEYVENVWKRLTPGRSKVKRSTEKMRKEERRMK